ncbi:hypothetical protein ACPESV_03620 [Streptomyces umbrinus]
MSQLLAAGHVHEEDVARLVLFVRRHINKPGRCRFQLPDLPPSTHRATS